MSDDYIMYCRGDEYEGGCQSTVTPPKIGNERFDITVAVGWSFDSDEGFWRCPDCAEQKGTP